MISYILLGASFGNPSDKDGFKFGLEMKEKDLIILNES